MLLMGFVVVFSDKEIQIKHPTEDYSLILMTFPEETIASSGHTRTHRWQPTHFLGSMRGFLSGAKLMA